MKDDRKFLREQADRMADVTCDFIGQKLAEKVDESIDFTTNKMHVSMGLDVAAVREVNVEFERIEYEKEEKFNRREKLLKENKFKLKKISEYRELLNEDPEGKFHDGIGVRSRSSTEG